MRFLQTTGNSALDRELEEIRRLASRPATAPSAATTASAATTLTVQSQVIAQSVDGTFVQQANGLMFDTADGFVLSTNGDFTRVDLALTPGAGISISGATIANAGVTSFNGNTGAVTYTAPVSSVNGNTGAVTVNNDIALVTSDPGSPRSGQVWYRTDLNQLSIWNGSAVKRSAVFT